MEIEDALHRCGGAARWSRLRKLGVTAHGLRTALAAGRGCRQRAHGVQVHSAALAPEDTEIDQPLTTIRRTVRDCARTMPRLESVVLLDGVGPVDFLVNGWLIIEPDGFAFHSNREHYRRDRRRGNTIAERPLVQLRFTYEDLTFHRGATLRQLLRVLEAGPRR